jgi:hypothetical protein
MTDDDATPIETGLDPRTTASGSGAFTNGSISSATSNSFAVLP